MKRHFKPSTLALTFVIALLVAWNLLPTVTASDDKKEKDPAVERTRKTVRMLDDIYKTAVVLITKHYVEDDDDLAAGEAAIALFGAIKEKGWHEVQLLDVAGDPINADNVADDAFEKAATKQIKAGKQWYEQIEEKDGKRILRAATPIPVVLPKCVMCHPNYKEAKKGEAIGLLSYTIEIE